MTPTQRTLKALRDRGMECQVVEQWKAYAKRPGGGPPGIRKDLFGIIDVIALDQRRGVIGVQCCGLDFAGHVRKLTESHARQSYNWLTTPGTALEIWGWRKVVKKPGQRRKVWEPRIREITLDDLRVSVLTLEDLW